MITPPGLAAARALHAPVGVFDAGIGSFDLVRRLRAAFPAQDVIYFADRASFPYGKKTESELLESVVRASRFLVDAGAGSIVLASNAPSVTVLDRLRDHIDVPILGVLPPVRQAMAALASTGILAIAGARVLAESRALQELVAAEAGDQRHRVVTVAADGLIALVESGAFLDTGRVRGPVTEFVSRLQAEHPALAGLSLSSTHLPWLASTFAQVAPDLALFDPASDVVAAFAPYATAGTGQLVSLATQSPAHPMEEFEAMLNALQLELSPNLVSF